MMGKSRLKGKNNFKTERVKIFLRLILFGILSLCYLVLFFNADGHLITKGLVDGEFHFSRIMSLSNIWQSPVNFHYYGHTGQIVNLMYPWATVYPMYLLMKITDSIVAGYFIYMLVLTFITLEVTYQCMRKIKQSTLPSILTSVLYTFAICRTSDIYCRGDIGETISLTIFPIVLLGIYQLLYVEKPRWKTLVLGMTLLVYTHLLSLIIAACLVLFFVVVQLCHHKVKVIHFVDLLKATLMSVLLGLGFLVPMLQVLSTTKINGPSKFDLYDAALKPVNLWQWSLQNQATTRDLYGVVFLVVIICVILNLKIFKGFYKDVVFGFAFFTFMSTTLFPWGIFQKQFEMLQFPWRFITVSTLLLCVAASELLCDWEMGHTPINTQKVLVIIIMLIVVSHWGTMNDVYRWNGGQVGDDSSSYVADLKEDTNFNGFADYSPAASGSDAEMISKQKMCVNQQWVPVDRQVTANRINYQFDSSNETTAILPVYVYPGEKVKQNGVIVPVTIADADGATQINLVSGVNKIEISYGYTTLARVAWIASILCCIIFNGIILYRKKLGQVNESN